MAKWWSVLAGSMDALTGILLVFAPGLVLRLLGISHAGPLVFVSWIGVFVAAVGLSYGLVFRGPAAGETVWAFTALARSLVFVFLTVHVALGRMETAWLLVAVSDAAVAAVQFAGLRAGWWRGGGP